MNKILITLFVWFIQVQCENITTTIESNFSNDEGVTDPTINITDVMNKTLTGINKMVNETISMNGVMKNLIRKRRRAPPDDDNDTFAPDTILIDTSKIDESPRSMQNKVQNPTKSLMPMNEAIKLRNKQPIKPINFEVKMPHSANSDKLPPHGYFDNDDHYNYESRKLFRRPPNFPTSSPELTSKYKSRKKTVKKDLSSLKNDRFEQR